MPFDLEDPRDKWPQWLVWSDDRESDWSAKRKAYQVPHKGPYLDIAEPEKPKGERQWAVTFRLKPRPQVIVHYNDNGPDFMWHKFMEIDLENEVTIRELAKLGGTNGTT